MGGLDRRNARCELPGYITGRVAGQPQLRSGGSIGDEPGGRIAAAVNPMLRWRAGLWSVCFAALAACLSPEPEQTVRYRHPNGLSLDLPESLVVERTPDGFRVRPAGAGNAVRNPVEVVASLRPGAARRGRTEGAGGPGAARATGCWRTKGAPAARAIGWRRGRSIPAGTSASSSTRSGRAAHPTSRSRGG